MAGDGSKASSPPAVPVPVAVAPVSPQIVGSAFFTRRPRIGEALVREGILSPDQLQKALADQKATGRMLGELLVEQNVGYALSKADRAYVLRSGRIILEESGHEMRRREHFWDLF